nr:RNA polymerase sigma factor [Polyangium spumosum]
MARALETCSGSTTACSRQVVQGALGGKPRSLAPAQAGEITTPEEEAGFNRCVEALHHRDAYGNSDRSEGIRIAYGYTRDKDSAEEIVQEIIVAVCTRSQRLRNVREYFFKSVRNAAFKETRQGRRSCPLDPNDPPPFPVACFQDGPIPDLLREEAREKAVYDALCGLKPEERKVIVQHLWEDRPHAEIAQRLNLTTEAVRQRYSRAVRALKEKFDERCQ